MEKHVTPSHPQKTVGAYLRVVKALQALDDMGENTCVDWLQPSIVGLIGAIEQNSDGVWTFVQA